MSNKEINEVFVKHLQNACSHPESKREEHEGATICGVCGKILHINLGRE